MKIFHFSVCSNICVCVCVCDVPSLIVCLHYSIQPNRDFSFLLGGVWQKSHRSHTAKGRPCTKSLVYPTTDRQEWWTGTVFFKCNFSRTVAKLNIPFVFHVFSCCLSSFCSLFFFFFYILFLNCIDFNCFDSRLDNGYKSSSRLQSQTAMHPPPSPPSPPNTRSRSSSTSTSSGSLPSWGSMRGLPNFFRFTRTSIRKWRWKPMVDNWVKSRATNVTTLFIRSLVCTTTENDKDKKILLCSQLIPFPLESLTKFKFTECACLCMNECACIKVDDEWKKKRKISRSTSRVYVKR